MPDTPSRRRGRCRTQKPRPEFTIAWANVAKSAQCHATLLQSAYAEKIDVVCVQEPWIYTGTKTQNHPAFNCHAPADAWDSRNTEHLATIRPRVMTYTRKGANLRTQQRRPVRSRDLLWTEVNGFLILNAYRQPNTREVIDYVSSLSPGSRTVVGGDFNCTHDMFEPGTDSGRRGRELADWATDSEMDFIGDPGVPTHRRGHVLDLTFSNIPFAKTEVRPDMYCGSDHFTQVTTIPSRGNAALEQYHYRVPETEMAKFSSLVELGVAGLQDPWTLQTTDEIDSYTQHLAIVFEDAIRTAGKVNRDKAKSAPWWTPECEQAYQNHLAHMQDPGASPSNETRNFLSIVRRAKREYWTMRIDGVNSDKQLYSIINWHKLAPNLQGPPLVIEGQSIEGTLEKAEALRAAVLDRFDSQDDLQDDPLLDWIGEGNLPWNTSISLEEAERNCIGVSSTSPGTDRVTVRLLKACWEPVKHYIHGLYNRCLQLEYFPQHWRVAEVVMLPKVGKKDKTSPRSWRPIALISCLSKGLERVVARRISWTALIHQILSPQHGGALPRRSAMDLVAAFAHDVELALASHLQVTVCTMDVMGAFDALLKRRLLRRMTAQGWPISCLRFIDSFLTNRQVQVRLEGTTTPRYRVDCGTPQGSPLSPVLYMLYLAELLSQDRNLRFGYADDLCLYRVSHSLDSNVAQLTQDIASILRWGDENKIFFAPEKFEMLHISRKRDLYNPPCVVNDQLTITPVPTTAELLPQTLGEPPHQQPGLRWLGVWFDRKFRFKRHVTERVEKARRVAYHIRSLARIAHGPPAASLRQAVITCVLPSVLYGSEAWYGGRLKPSNQTYNNCQAQVSTRQGGLIDIVQKTLNIAVRGVLPVWRTTPTATLFRDSGLPSAEVALEEAKIRFAKRLQTVDDCHLLVRRIQPPTRQRGRAAGTPSRTVTKVQMLGQLLPSVPRPRLTPPHFTPGCRTDPTAGLPKEAAAAEFNQWWDKLPPGQVLVFSDGSEQHKDCNRYVGYGYAIYQNKQLLATGSESINPLSHVFDAEAIGAWRGLQRTLRMAPEIRDQRIWMCIDSTSVIWCIRGNSSPTSQWAFLNCQGAMQVHDIQLKWSPGHMGIEGNETADRMADIGARQILHDDSLSSRPTISGIGSLARKLRDQSRDIWWTARSIKMSKAYQQWDLPYRLKAPPELILPRRVLHRYLALRTTHGDFAWYHTKFNHLDAETRCSCGFLKTPDHLVRCRIVHKSFFRWPKDIRPLSPPTTELEARSFIKDLLDNPLLFAEYLQVTGFYSKICTR